jgi:thioredoxin reductase (NADPH)
MISSMNQEIRDTVIIGAGCAGLTAAIYAGRANLKPLVLQGHEPGGQLSMTTLVENFPGFPEGIQGPELIENMKKQAARFGAEFQTGHLAHADLRQRPFVLDLGKEKLRTRTLIVGGGDSAMEEALFLTRFATRVSLIHRRDQFRASKIMLERARQNQRIRFLTDTVVEDVYDVNRQEVTGLKLRNVKTGAVSDFPASALFLAIGHVPNAAMFDGQLEKDADGYLKTENYVFTRVPGVFACGDVQDRRYRQAITASGSGCMAAMEAEKFLEEHGR